LLYYLTAALTNLNLQISSAKVSTFGHRAVDGVYVKDHFGLKVESDARLKILHGALMTVLAEAEPESALQSRALTVDSWPPVAPSTAAQ
jgi:[protein-PII] uridylyltransferase